jgi:hypothetical protein
MKEDEKIVAYFLRVGETVNSIKGFGEEMKEIVIVQKVLRSLTMIYYMKISSLEEREDIDTMIMDELHEILTYYEMMAEQYNTITKEETSKSSKRIKNKDKQKVK